MLTSSVDLRVFDSGHQEAIWEMLKLRVIPSEIIDLMAGLRSGSECCELVG